MTQSFEQRLKECIAHASEYKKWCEDADVQMTDIEEDLLFLVKAATRYLRLCEGLPEPLPIYPNQSDAAYCEADGHNKLLSRVKELMEIE